MIRASMMKIARRSPCLRFRFGPTVAAAACAVCLMNAGPADALGAGTNSAPHWAAPVRTDGVPNLHKVSDTLYRSAQPDAAGMLQLRRMGIKTVINLRSMHDDRDEASGSGLTLEDIPMTAWRPRHEDAVRFLKVVTDPDRTPVLVHCMHGSDRTGAMCALYRVAVQGWSREEAVREMCSELFGFHSVFGGLREWLMELDIAGIMEQVSAPPLASNAPERSTAAAGEQRPPQEREQAE